jgi:Tripartite tricarboxylate transporter family receptor
MRIFRSVVAPPPAFMAMGDPKITSGRTVRSKVIGHNLVRNKANFLEQFPHQFQCSPLVPLALHENVEDFALSIDGTPQVDQPAIDFDEYLVKMPSGMRLGPASSKVSGDHGTKVFHPATHRLIGNDDPALSQQVLDIAKAEAEPGIEPDGLLNDHGGKAVSSVADLGHNGRLPPGITADKPNNVTMPWTALFLPRRTPDAIVQTLNNAIVQALHTPTVRAHILELGSAVVSDERANPQYLAGFVKSEIEKWAGPIRASGVSMD